MSFPYTTTSPPPTSGALTVVDRANESLSYATGGGGGGSLPANPAFSTLTIASQAVGDQQNLVLSVNSGNQVIFGGGVAAVVMDKLDVNTSLSFGSQALVTFSGGIAFQDPGANQDPNFEILTNATTAEIGLPSFTDTGTVISVIDSQSPPGGLSFLAGNSGNSYITAVNGNGIQSTLFIAANPLISLGAFEVSTLTVSSINGAAPGGGGGPVSPNLTLSTLTMNQSSILTGVSTIIPAYQILTIQDGLAGGVFSINLENNGVVLSLDSGGMVIASLTSGQGDSDLLIQGRGSASILLSTNVMALTGVSSINGAAPGGGSVSANLGLSTLTFGGPENPSLFLENTTLLMNTEAQATTLGQASLSWNNASSNIQLIAPSTTSVFIGTEKLGGSVSVRDDGVYCSPFLSTPNLTVSTINGAAYPPSAAAYPNVSTFISTGGGAQIQFNTSTNAAVQIGPAMSTTIGHNYQITFPIGMTPSSAPFYDDRLTFTYQNDGVGAIAAFQTEPILTGGGVATPYTYKARLGTGGVAFSVEASTSAPVLITLDNLQGITLVDLGPST